MKKSIIAVMTVLALGASSVYAADGGDRTFDRSAAHMKIAMEAYAANQAQASASTQIANTAQADMNTPSATVQK